MKSNFLLAFALLLFAFATSKANNHYTDRDDKQYFKSFRKNEEPKNKTFNILTKISENASNSFYVIYKENSLGQGFYFKVILDKNEKPIATYYSDEGRQQLSDSTVKNLKKLLSGPTGRLAASVDPITTTQCVTNCHRTNGCYSKPTETGVLLCSLECGIACA